MGSSRHAPGWDVLQMSGYTRPSNKAEVAGLAKCNAPEAREYPCLRLRPFAGPYWLLAVARPGQLQVAVEGEKEETLPTAGECRQQMLTTGGGPLSGVPR